MNYTIHQLQIFLKVVQKESITKASQELFMTQPAVSIQLKNFQGQFDISLYEIIGRKLHITDFGKEIAIIAERVIEELNNINYKTEAYRGMLTGKLKISSASTGKYVIPFFLEEFLSQNPGIDLVLDVTNKTRVIQSLKNNEIDFALVSVIPGLLDVEEELLIDNKLYLISNEPKRNDSKALIYREEGSATRSAMEHYYGTHNSKDRKRLELTSNEAVKQAVIAGLGNSIMPLIGIKNELLDKQLYILPADDLPLKTKWRLIWLSGKRISPVAQAYLDFIRVRKNEILDKKFKWYLDYK
ncbi:LysR substrate-binding domain-containing protein [Marivirga harenae]|uniref:LysR substrate-binding domain-containing protein n=1 Tax=Marivirga harenae TaxID=2010992 RepID=UPI0026DF2C35|nr:LysR substrate-binding domain-containing protein [Marivirga harenae]WKV10542.1 LysR substrate-binding domain-containing protein [Marivirga harenae]|tara:strand:- start:500382 stop:501278 length:897 start_codon:yes stop_codon:yes gene_type:complete